MGRYKRVVLVFIVVFALSASLDMFLSLSSGAGSLIINNAISAMIPTAIFLYKELKSGRF